MLRCLEDLTGNLRLTVSLLLGAAKELSLFSDAADEDNEVKLDSSLDTVPERLERILLLGCSPFNAWLVELLLFILLALMPGSVVPLTLSDWLALEWVELLLLILLALVLGSVVPLALSDWLALEWVELLLLILLALMLGSVVPLTCDSLALEWRLPVEDAFDL